MLMLKADWSREVKSNSKLPAISAVKKDLQKSLLPMQLACSGACVSQGLDACHSLLLSGVPSLALQTLMGPMATANKGVNPCQLLAVHSSHPFHALTLLAAPCCSLQCHWIFLGTWDLSWRGAHQALDLVLCYCE